MRRDEHFARELKIKNYYVWFFCFILVFKLIAFIQDCIYPEQCQTICRIIWVIITTTNFLLLLIYFISAYFLFHYSKKHRYFVYRKNKNVYILQAIFILLGLSSSIAYCISVKHLSDVKL